MIVMGMGAFRANIGIKQFCTEIFPCYVHEFHLMIRENVNEKKWEIDWDISSATAYKTKDFHCKNVTSWDNELNNLSAPTTGRGIF